MRDNTALKTLGMGMLGSGILMATGIDSHVRGYFQEKHPLRKISLLGDKAGESGPIYAGFMLFLLGGMIDDKKMLKTSKALLRALIIDGVTTSGLKEMIGRSRPKANEGPYEFQMLSGNRSLPSGHTSSMFAAALSEMYKDIPILRVLTYGIATFVAVSRIEEDKHWLSDVFLGAIKGHAIGTAVARRSLLEDESDKSALRIYPFIKHVESTDSQQEHYIYGFVAEKWF